MRRDRAWSDGPRAAALAFALLAGCGGGGGGGDSSGGGGGGGGGNPATNVAATFFGGKLPLNSAHDRAQGVWVIPGSERVIIAGNTGSTDYGQRYPGVPGHDQSFNGYSDAFVAILESDLSSVVAWTYLGGTDEDRAYQAMNDSQGNVWVVGFTRSQDFPAVGGGDAFTADRDAFAAKYSPDLGQLLFCTSIGGANDDYTRGSLGIDAFDRVYVSGNTSSSDFPTSAQPGNTLFDASYNGGVDAFLIQFESDGAVLWSTFFGGTQDDSALANVRATPAGDAVYIGGATSSDTITHGFPVTAGAFQQDYGGTDDPQSNGDGFVAKFSATGQRLECTYIGGDRMDNVLYNDGLELAPSGEVVIIGATRSSPSTFPETANAFDKLHHGPTTGPTGVDGYVAVFSEDLSSLILCTYLGGADHDEPSGLDVDAAGRIYVSGNTSSSDFPTTPNAYSTDCAGDVDAFVAQITFDSGSSSLDYSTYFGGATTVGSGLFGDRARGLSVRASDGLVVIAGDSDSTDLPTTNGVVDPDFIGGPSDGFVAEHDTQP